MSVGKDILDKFKLEMQKLEQRKNERGAVGTDPRLGPRGSWNQEMEYRQQLDMYKLQMSVQQQQQMSVQQQQMQQQNYNSLNALSPDFRYVKSASDLDHAVFKTPIDTLVNLWVAKFGVDWVEKDKVLGDEFFEWAALRLRSTGKLEEHSIWPTAPDRQQIPGIAQGITAGGQRIVVLRIVE